MCVQQLCVIGNAAMQAMMVAAVVAAAVRAHTCTTAMWGR